jgi:DNA-directed RNA polymerase specialized sigma24 family protein
MADRDWLAELFEANRPRLQALVYHMLGSPSEADDAVQESWLRTVDRRQRAWRTSAAGSTPWWRECAWICCARGNRAGKSH